MDLSGGAGAKQTERRAQMIAAATESLKDVGYAGTSIREIARRGGFNSALISYYFGGLHGLLLAALDNSSRAFRMLRYGQALEEAKGIEDVMSVARLIYREDVEGGHITIFTEMVAASLAHPELRPELIARAEPWIDFVQEAVEKAAGANPLLQLMPPRDLAYSIICLYLGVNLMTQLEDDTIRVEGMFELGSRLAPLLAPMFPQT